MVDSRLLRGAFFGHDLTWHHTVPNRRVMILMIIGGMEGTSYVRTRTYYM